MAQPTQAWKRRRLLHALAGLETGVLAGAATLAWLIGGSAGLFRQPWWAIPNLMASGFYGDAVFRGGPGMISLTGAALHVVMSGLIGALFGLIVPESLGYLRLALLGIGFGLSWYYLTVSVSCNILCPLLPLYASHSLLYSAHLLYGAMLPLIRLNFGLLVTPSVPAGGNPAES